VVPIRCTKARWRMNCRISAIVNRWFFWAC